MLPEIVTGSCFCYIRNSNSHVASKDTQPHSTMRLIYQSKFKIQSWKIKIIVFYVADKTSLQFHASSSNMIFCCKTAMKYKKKDFQPAFEVTIWKSMIYCNLPVSYLDRKQLLFRNILCNFFMDILRKLLPLSTDSAAAVPAACPVIIQPGTIRIEACIARSVEIQRPAISRLVVFFGSRARYGMP